MTFDIAAATMTISNSHVSVTKNLAGDIQRQRFLHD